jgi:hypothetical protein
LIAFALGDYSGAGYSLNVASPCSGRIANIEGNGDSVAVTMKSASNPGVSMHFTKGIAFAYLAPPQLCPVRFVSNAHPNQASF